MPKKGWAWTVCRFKGGLARKGGGVFEGEWGLIPQCTLWRQSSLQADL